MQTVAIVGVGLIGGSFGLALRKAGFQGKILGVSSAAAVLRAQEVGAIDESASLEDAASQADLLYLAQPIQRILSTLTELPNHINRGALVTDAGSTKHAIVQQASDHLAGILFLGGHPIAGREVRGVDGAAANLFDGRSYVLTPRSAADLENDAAKEFIGWIQAMGAKPVYMEPFEHDRTLAYTSHLPQLASTALSALLSECGENVRRVFGPALVDSTRLALSSIDIWNDIILTNQPDISNALGEYIQKLEYLRKNLTAPEVRRIFAEGAEFAALLRRQEAR